MNETALFDSAALLLLGEVRSALLKLAPDIRATAQEIRLRQNKPLCVTLKGEGYFVSNTGELSKTGGLTVTERALEECFLSLCGHSTFAHEEELKQGFISLKNGGRVGVCGVFAQNSIPSEIFSLNIRIAREIFGCADLLLQNCAIWSGLLIAGPPASGKTTVLRDLIRQLSQKGNRICVIDSRRELSFGDLGACSDVIISQNRARAAEMCLRTMYPQIIALDEIASTDELAAITQSFFGGVVPIVTAHAANLYDLKSRAVTKELIKSGAISEIALLGKIGEPPRIFGAKGLLA